ncbi:hypothetical protein ACTA71_008085 [Dictyostelium dimigraforme]
MFKLYSLFCIVSYFSLFYVSSSLISNYVPVIGSDLLTPADITRASLLTYDDQTGAMAFAKSIPLESPSDVFNITFSKYYLNNIIALSNNNLFGALSHYNSLISLYNNVNNLALVGLNNTVGHINTLSKFTNLDTSKFQLISSSINNYISNINSIQTTAESFATLMNNTKNSLSPNSPNAATVQIVKDNYDLVIKSVLSIVSHLNSLKTPLSDMENLVSTFQNEVFLYTQFLLADEDYMSHMKTLMKTFLFYSNTLYSRSLLLSRLKDLF